MICILTKSDAAQWQIIAHLDSRGGLCEATDKYIHQLTAVRRHLAGLALQVVAGAPGNDQVVLRRWLVVENGRNHQYEASLQSSKDQEAGLLALGSFLPWAKEKLNKGPTVFLYMGHGTGLIDERHVLSSRIIQLRNILSAEVKRSGSPFALIALDTCFGSCIETAYELQGMALYITVAPGLIYSPGLDWSNILRNSQARNGDPRNLSGIIVKHGMNNANTIHSELVALKLEHVSELTEKLNSLTVSLIDNLSEEAPVLRVVRSRCHNWGYRNELCDLGQLLTGISINASSSDVKKRASDCLDELYKVVIASNIEVNHETPNVISGLGIYFPASIQVFPVYSLPTLSFNMSTGWSSFLEEYWRVSQDQLFRVNE